MSRKSHSETRKLSSVEKRLRWALAATSLFTAGLLGACDNNDDDSRKLKGNEIVITITPSPTATIAPTETPRATQDTSVSPDISGDESIDFAREVPSLSIEAGFDTGSTTLEIMNAYFEQYVANTNAFNADSETLLEDNPSYLQVLPAKKGETVQAMRFDRGATLTDMNDYLPFGTWTVLSEETSRGQLLAAQAKLDSLYETVQIDNGNDTETLLTVTPADLEQSLGLWVTPTESVQADAYGDDYQRVIAFGRGFESLQPISTLAFMDLAKMYSDKHDLNWSFAQLQTVAIQANTAINQTFLRESTAGMKNFRLRNADGSYAVLSQFPADPEMRQVSLNPDTDGTDREDQTFGTQCIVIQDLENQNIPFGEKLDGDKDGIYKFSMVTDLDAYPADLSPEQFAAQITQRTAVQIDHEDQTEEAFNLPAGYEVTETDPDQQDMFPLLQGCEPDVAPERPAPVLATSTATARSVFQPPVENPPQVPPTEDVPPATEAPGSTPIYTPEATSTPGPTATVVVEPTKTAVPTENPTSTPEPTPTEQATLTPMPTEPATLTPEKAPDTDPGDDVIDDDQPIDEIIPTITEIPAATAPGPTPPPGF